MSEDVVSSASLMRAAEMLERLSGERPETQSTKSTAPSAKSRRQYRKQVAVDLHLLKSAAEKVGVSSKQRNSEELLLLVLEAVLADDRPIVPAAPTKAAPSIAPPGASAVDLQVVADQAKTMVWLTSEVEALRSHMLELEEQLARQGVGTPAALQRENERLRAERDAAIEKLETSRKLLDGNEPKRSASLSTRKARPQAAQSASRPVTSAPKPAAIALREADLDPGILRALYALIDYNNAQANHADKWAISFPVMKDLCKQIGVATQSKIDKVFQAKAELIKQHHREHGLGQRHNRVHRGQNVTSVVSLSS